MNLEAYLPPGVTIDDAIIGMSSFSALAVAVLVWVALLARDPGIKRARALGAQRAALRAGAGGPVRRKERLQTLGLMHKVVSQLRLLKSVQARKISIKLMHAGWRSKDVLVKFFFFKLSLPFIFGGIAVFFVYGLDIYQLEPPMKALVALGSVMVGAYAPDVVVKNAAQKRQDMIRKALPDALDLMVICAEAGLSLDATLVRVADEIESSTPELADELTVTGLELGFLPDRRQALKNFGIRTDLVVIRGMVNTLLQSERYGTPLAHSLRVMAAESRDERMMRAEEKAARLPALLTVPMIIFILPPLFIVLIGPAALSIVDTLSKM